MNKLFWIGYGIVISLVAMAIYHFSIEDLGLVVAALCVTMLVILLNGSDVYGGTKEVNYKAIYEEVKSKNVERIGDYSYTIKRGTKDSVVLFGDGVLKLDEGVFIYPAETFWITSVYSSYWYRKFVKLFENV